MSSENQLKHKTIILDSHALITYFEGEIGAEHVIKVFEEAHRGERTVALTLINLGEILYITERERGLSLAQATLAAIQQLPIDVLEVDQRLVLSAAHIKANYPLSYADAFVVAAAVMLGGSILTGDPEFHSVHNLVDIDWLPEGGIN
jgi:ribonuclease VapC